MQAFFLRSATAFWSTKIGAQILKKTRKNMKILPLNSYSTRVPIEKMLELQMLSFEMKKYMVLRLAEMEQN